MSDDIHTNAGEPTADDHRSGGPTDGSEVPLDDAAEVADGADEATFESGAEDGPRESADPGVVVPKATYCESCEHFTDPPDVACTHEGTRIAELVDREHFRVVDCPVVAEREALDDQ